MLESYAYIPRPVVADPVVTIDRWIVKPYRIDLPERTSDDGRRIDKSLLEEAFAMFDCAEGEPHVGFAIEHRSRDGVYLLTAHWTGGHNLASRTFLVIEDSGADARLAPFHLFACIWELAIYAFERDRWVEIVMAGGGSKTAVDAYLTARMERPA